MTGQQLGKEALLDAASVLFDEQGVDAVSLNEVTRASGHRNRSAATYHFGGKDAVVQAVVERMMGPADDRRVELLDALATASGEPGLRSVLDASVTPMVEMLATIEGRRHLRLLGQLVGHPGYYPAAQAVTRARPGISRSAEYLFGALAGLPDPVRAERTSQVASFVIRALADQARLLDAGEPTRAALDTQRFTSNLLDLLVAMVEAPHTPVG